MRWDLLANTLWDMFLAAIPAVLGWLLAGGMRSTPNRRLWLWAPLLILWLIFLPNTCYLLTELRHLRWRLDSADLPDSGMDRPDSLQRLLRWTLFYAIFSGFGLLTFALAIRPLERFARSRGFPLNALAPPFFLLMAVGVYLGLRLRFNSWDLLHQPLRVAQTAWETLTSPGAARLYILSFAVFLWLVYVVLDIWLDGLYLRVERWRVISADRPARRRPPPSSRN